MRADLHLKNDSSDDDIRKFDKPYRELIGSLMYLACMTRPDIMFATAYLARYVSCDDGERWNAAKRIVKYLSSFIEMSLCYGAQNEDVTMYTDSDWAVDQEERKSTGVFVFTFMGASFCWSSKRQSVVAASSVEAEYIAQARLWIRKLLKDFGINVGTVDFRADNQGAIANAKLCKSNMSTKHIAVAYHLQRDYVAKKMVSITYVLSEDMLEDGITKALGKEKHARNCTMYGLRYLNAGSI